MNFIKARCLCSKHGKLSLNEIMIKNGNPVCDKCFSVLEFADVRPRSV